MVRALVAPGEESALKVVENNWEAYHRNGRDALVPLYLPDVSLWPDGGGFAELSAVIGGESDLREGTVINYLKMVDLKHARADLGYEPDEHHARQKMVPAALAEGAEALAGASLGHLAAWLEARKLRRESLIVNDWKTLIANHMGPPEDFDAFVMSFLRKGPKKGRAVPGQRRTRRDGARFEKAGGDVRERRVGRAVRGVQKPRRRRGRCELLRRERVFPGETTGVAAGVRVHRGGRVALRAVPGRAPGLLLAHAARLVLRAGARTSGGAPPPGRALSAHRGAPVPGGGVIKTVRKVRKKPRLG